MNLLEKYLAKAAELDSVSPGQDIRCRISLAAAHDVTGHMVISQFKLIGAKKVFDPKKVILVADHVYPAPTPGAREIHRTLRKFHEEYGVCLYDRGEGVIHQLISERHRVSPGEIVVCADSHTCTAGGYGAIGLGVGATELAAALATGTIDVEVPETVQINITGAFKPGVFGKDLILNLAARFGTDGLIDKALLFTGSGIKNISEQERMTICNMGVELGAVTALFGTDEIENDVSDTVEMLLDELPPLAACPFSPGNVKKVSELKGLKISQVVVGTCTNGRLNDMQQVYLALKGRKVADSVNMIVVPASVTILEEMEALGYVKEIRNAGAVIVNPGCGPCFGGHLGLAAGDDVVVSTSNRNFPGRMGHKEAQIYLVSPATAAASAIAGELVVYNDS